ncbi:unnamed protein product, partial [Mycena citricolor]
TLQLMERHTGTNLDSVIPTELERRFAAATAGFIRKYPENCLADRNGLCSVLDSAVDDGLFKNGFITDVDALRVVDTALSETEDQQKSHRDRAHTLRKRMQDRLRSAHIPAEPDPLVSEEAWEEHRKGCHFPLM